MPRLFRLVPALVLLASLSACEFSCNLGGIDAEKVEQNIASEFASQLQVTPKSVECPEGVKDEKGGQFVCKVTLEDDTTLEVTVEMTGDRNVVWEYNAFNTAEAEAVLVDSVGSKTGVNVASVECPVLVKLVPEGDTVFSCRAVDATGEAVPLEVTLTKDAQLNWEIGQAEPEPEPEAEPEGEPAQ